MTAFIQSRTRQSQAMAKATKGERNYARVHFVKEGTHLYASNAHVRIEKSLTDRHDVWWPSTPHERDGGSSQKLGG